MTDNIVNNLLKLAAASERRNLDSVSARIANVLREISAGAQRLATKDSSIEVESWPDFLNWWNNNRGQNLTYIFMDTYGPGSEQVTLVKRLVKDAEKHEKDLHEFYLTLRDLSTPKGVGEQPEATLPPEEVEPSDEEPSDEADLSEEAPEASTDDESLDEINLDLGD